MSRGGKEPHNYIAKDDVPLVLLLVWNMSPRYLRRGMLYVTRRRAEWLHRRPSYGRYDDWQSPRTAWRETTISTRLRALVRTGEPE